MKKFNITKEKIENEIKLILTQNNNQLIKNLQEKKYKLNGIDIKKIGDDIKIIDDNFIKDCLIVSKMNNYDCVFNISNKISSSLFGKYINFEYLNNNESQFNKIMVKLKIGNKVLATSDCSVNAKEAKLNAAIKFIKIFLQDQNSNEIINNIFENINKPKHAIKEKLFLSKKRKNKNTQFINYKENNENNSNKLLMNSENIPINEILLGDSRIVDNHLEDFKYTPLKMIEMIKNTEKYRGYDFVMSYSQINNKNYFYKNEVTIYSQKLGITALGFGKSRKEAENKCALRCLAMIFKNKFKTFYELHDYFQNKNGNYLDIII